jgi:hypothetical protein
MKSGWSKRQDVFSAGGIGMETRMHKEPVTPADAWNEIFGIQTVGLFLRSAVESGAEWQEVLRNELHRKADFMGSLTKGEIDRLYHLLECHVVEQTLFGKEF